MYVFMYSVVSETVVQSVRLQLSNVSFKSWWELSADYKWQSAVGAEQAVSWLWDRQINNYYWCVLPRTTSVRLCWPCTMSLSMIQSVLCV